MSFSLHVEKAAWDDLDRATDYYMSKGSFAAAKRLIEAAAEAFEGIRRN